VVVTTPYLIIHPRVAEWLEYLKRTLPKTQREEPRKAYDLRDPVPALSPRMLGVSSH
jgi:hypothetical protein